MEGLPPGPNVRVRYHWAKWGRIVQQWKGDAMRLAIDAKNRSPLAFPLRSAQVTVTHYLPDLRRRDDDNMKAACKPVIDGIVAAKVIADDSLGEIGQVIHTYEYRKGRPGLHIEVRSA